MNSHFHANLFTHRNDTLKEVDQIGTQRLIVHVFVFREQFLHAGQTFRFPAGQGEAVRIIQHLAHHLLKTLVDTFFSKAMVSEPSGRT